MIQCDTALRLLLWIDINREKKFDYKGLSEREKVEHIAEFISGIWQTHPFGEGNTRTIAIFTIKYLRAMGFDANNEFFENNAKYFRDALVRANYQNLKQDVPYTKTYLNMFFANLLLGEKNILDSKDLIINVGVKDKIIESIKQNPNITAKELAIAMDKTQRTIERHIKDLKEQGKLIRVGSDKTGYWEVT